MISDDVCKAGNYRENAAQKHALLEKRTNCSVIDYKGMFRRKTRNLWLVCQA